MFMFRSKRTALAKRLWKAKARREHEQEAMGAAGAGAGGGAGGGGGGGTTTSSYSAVLFKRLKVSDLETLVAAVEARGAGPASACVPLPRVPPLPHPHLLCCQMWRWPDLRHPSELKRLPACASASACDDEGLQICCNPYHWSRLCRPESPPPPYSRVARERLKPEDGAARAATPAGSAGSTSDRLLPGSLATNGEGSGGARGGEWCKLAYWELSRRVGRLFAVRSAAVDVFAAPAHGDGLCLDALRAEGQRLEDHRLERLEGPDPPRPDPPSPSPPLAVARTRSKIGRGVTLSHEGDAVWVYNRSEAPVFVNSPTLDDPDSRTLLVFRVPPGHCLSVFESGAAEAASARRRRWERLNRSGPTDAYSVRISFAKGWGPKYSRQEVTACPCWLEVLLGPCR